jgi:hypothetical protein
MIYPILTVLAIHLLISACTPSSAIQHTNPTITQSEPLPIASPTFPELEITNLLPSPSTPEDVENYPLAIWASIVDLASSLEISPDQVQVISFQEEEWPDSCLGSAAPDEMCLQVITPGYRILLGINGQRYEYHTDLSGGILRVIGDTLLQPVKSGLELNKPKAILAAIQALNQTTGIPMDDIKVASIETVVCPDSCLGLAKSTEMCAEIITPGWIIFLKAEDKTYEFHTDLSGENIRQK